MSPEMFLVLLSVAGFLCFGLTLASVGWRGDTNHRLDVLESRCARLEEQSRRWLEAKEAAR
jgi:hypothetical protein